LKNKNARIFNAEISLGTLLHEQCSSSRKITVDLEVVRGFREISELGDAMASDWRK